MFDVAAFKMLASLNDIIHPPKPAIPPSGQLAPGDILVKLNDAGKLNMFISFGQTLTTTGTHSLWTHAGLATSNTTIAEMDGKGLQQHSLSGENAGYVYAVFRCRYLQVAMGACEANATLMKHRDKVVYNHSGASGSLLPSMLDTEKNVMNQALTQMASGKTFSLFCSEHVVFCYQAAVEANGKFTLGSEFPTIDLRVQDFFGKRAWEYSPAYLYTQLLQSKAFDYMGRWNRMKWIA